MANNEAFETAPARKRLPEDCRKRVFIANAKADFELIDSEEAQYAWEFERPANGDAFVAVAARCIAAKLGGVSLLFGQYGVPAEGKVIRLTADNADLKRSSETVIIQ